MQTLELRLCGLEPVVDRIELLGFDHVEGLVLKVLLVGLAASLLVALLELLFVLRAVCLFVLQLLGQALALAPLKGVQVMGVDEAVGVVVLRGALQFLGIQVLQVVRLLFFFV